MCVNNTRPKEAMSVSQFSSAYWICGTISPMTTVTKTYELHPGDLPSSSFYPKPIEVYQFSHLRNIQKILEKTVEMMEKTVGFWWFLYIFDDQNPRGIHGIFVGHLHEESPRIILFPWHRQPGVWLVVNYPQYTYKYIYIHLWNIIVTGNETHTIQYHHSTAHIYRRCSHYH